MLQVVFHSTIGAERGDFTIDDIAGGVTQKLILRHPHVFGDEKLESAEDVLANWDELKANQRKTSGITEKARESILDDVPVHFPALLEGLKLTTKAAKVGFDWESTEQVFDKIAEEITELKVEIAADPKSQRTRDELGDLLFAVVNLARRLDVEPETALKRTNRKFRKRFRYIESELKRRDIILADASLQQMDALWDDAKVAETAPRD